MTDHGTLDQLAHHFEIARSLSGQARADYLREVHSISEKLWTRLETLLQEHERTGMLDEQLDPIRDARDLPPDHVDGYTIEGVLGYGAMGSVYRAHQQSPDRVVALKVLRTGLGTSELRRRFAFESDALGRLNHPNIASIYEVGTVQDPGGRRPFFVMEYVQGTTLDQYLQEHPRSIEDRVRLMIQICDGVQHAHVKGIIHRDLKPANIMIDTDGNPKLLDFGVARSIDADPSATLATRHGDLIGTLRYMSPEQADPDGREIDTRADVYALGMILYEMLTGDTPYDLTNVSISNAARAIAHTPPTPLPKTNPALRGDLNTITLKALRKDPAARYQTALELSQDLRRYLAHEPISARPATLWYVSSRFARRHRGLVASAFLVLVLGAIALSTVVWQSSRIAAEAETRLDVAGFLEEMLTSLDPAKTGGETLTVRRMLDDASARLPDRFDRSPGVRGELHVTVGQTYHELGAYEEARHHLDLGIADLTAGYGPNDDRTIEAMAALGLCLRNLGDLESAMRVLDEAVSRGDPDNRMVMLANVNKVALLDKMGQIEEAVQLSELNHARLERVLGPRSSMTVSSLNNRGILLQKLNRHEEAKPLLELCYELRRQTHGKDHPDTLTSMVNLSVIYWFTGRRDEARSLAEEAAVRSERVLGSTHLSTLQRRQNVIRTLITSDPPRAIAESTRLLEDCERTLSPGHDARLGALEMAATAMALGGNFDGALELALSHHARLVQTLGSGSPASGRAAYLVYDLYDEIGDEPNKAHWMNLVEQSGYKR